MVTRLLGLLGIICLSMGHLAESVQAGGAEVYRGKWQSQSTGHQGPMRVKVTPRGDGNYDARFTGRFFVLIPFTYKVQLNSQGRTECGEQLSAYRKLGPLLGSYQMSAQKTPGTLTGSFSAAGDTGVITMTRIK